MSTIVLAYSGGLDTSVLLKKYVLAGHRVIAMTLDLGESDGTAGAGASAALDEVKAKALALGAYDALLVDAKERFIDELALPALRANALTSADRSAARGDRASLRRRRRRARLHG
jgi:argininosuccinate synthase